MTTFVPPLSHLCGVFCTLLLFIFPRCHLVTCKAEKQQKGWMLQNRQGPCWQRRLRDQNSILDEIHLCFLFYYFESHARGLLLLRSMETLSTSSPWLIYKCSTIQLNHNATISFQERVIFEDFHNLEQIFLSLHWNISFLLLIICNEQP